MIVENIKRVAASKQMSLASVERKAGLTQGHIYKWSKGNSPTLESIVRVADALGCTVDELIRHD